MSPTLILALVGGALDLVPKLQQVIAHLNQSDELTPAQKQQLRQKVEDAGLDPAWQPDPESGN